MKQFDVPYGSHRGLEVIPGILLWATFILSIAVSVVEPLWAIYYIILFDLYWLFRVVYFVIYLTYAWVRYHNALKTQWMEKLQKECPKWKEMYHLIFLPTYKEGIDIIDSTLESLQHCNYPSNRFIIVLAGEERAGPEFVERAALMKKKYSKAFHRFFVTVHPDGVKGEMASKGANINYAGRQAQKEIDALGIPYEKVIVSAFDIDTIAHPDYFACLTQAYCTHPNPTRSSYQPVVLYNNNMWDSPAPTRLAAFSTTFWLMSELSRPERLFTFSSHSMSFRALVDVGFWQNNIVSEDSRIFLQCFIHYDGDYEVTPLYVPVSMDTVLAESKWKSLVNLYKQQRRWAWGVEHFAFMVINFRANPLIPLRKKVRFLFNQLEGMFTWATAPIIITILGRLPLYFARDDVRSLVIAQNTPFILETLLNLSLLGAFIIATMSLLILPARPTNHPVHRFLYMILQWILLPVTLIVFSALPAIDAQTRLMIGKYLGFWVTDKKRVS